MPRRWTTEPQGERGRGRGGEGGVVPPLLLPSPPTCSPRSAVPSRVSQTRGNLKPRSLFPRVTGQPSKHKDVTRNQTKEEGHRTETGVLRKKLCDGVTVMGLLLLTGSELNNLSYLFKLSLGRNAQNKKKNYQPSIYLSVDKVLRGRQVVSMRRESDRCSVGYICTHQTVQDGIYHVLLYHTKCVQRHAG